MTMDLNALKSEIQTLIREKSRLQQELERYQEAEKESSESCLKYKMKLFKTKEERDRTYDSLQSCKKQYNSLYDAYVAKTRRLMAIEEVFTKQKKLPGLISKEASLMMKRMKASETEESQEEEIRSLRTQLEEAYNIIDELDFELESVDVLEVENMKLTEELNSMKQSLNGNDSSPKRNFSSSVDPDQEEDDFCEMAETFKVLPPREIKKAEMESQTLHREVLRSKIKHTRDSRDMLKETTA